MSDGARADAASAPRPAPGQVPHLVLVGLPGVGKTTVGEAAARALGRPFLDFDREIERREGISIATVFAEHGESRFRSLELALTAEVAGRAAGMVLAPGGGWIAVPGAVALLRPRARIIYLRAEPETVLRRLGAARELRPLLARTDPLPALHRLLAEREPLYLTADQVIDTDRASLGEVVDRVVAVGRTGAPPADG